MRIDKLIDALLMAGGVLLLVGTVHNAAAEPVEPAEITLGERLFLETRFAQAYYANPQKADPVVSHTVTSSGELPGPFKGKTINCRSCHFVDEHLDTAVAGIRTYADFAPRSPVPARNDGMQTAARNAMSMVNVSIPREHGVLFHFDGQFNSLEDLVRGTLTGRNFGWLPDEEQMAIKHIARIIRDDDGKAELAKEFGGSYRKVLNGTAKDLDPAFILPAEYRIEVDKATDRQILNAVAKLIAVYVRDLTFAMDDNGHYSGSPYDRFLELNKLPRIPHNNETLAAYNQRLLKLVNGLKKPRFVTAKDGKFSYHQQDFVFGEQQLAGMKLFFTMGDKNSRGGNCAACHTAPHFSDFSFHNTGLSQINYDRLHGSGKFMQLEIPDLITRNQKYNRYLPATPQHPKANSRFRSMPSKARPANTDLGLWNVFANPDMPNPQAKLKNMLCKQARQRDVNSNTEQCTEQQLLPLSIAAFKTPVLRDLGHSNPYMHTGQFNHLEGAVRFYITSSAIARQQKMRNTDPALQHINLTPDNINALVTFLKALNEDYD